MILFPGVTFRRADSARANRVLIDVWRAGMFERPSQRWFDQPIVCLAPLIIVSLLGIFEPEVVRQMHPTLHKAFKLAACVCYVMSFFSMLQWRGFPKTCVFALALVASSVLSACAVQGFDLSVVCSKIKLGVQLFLACGLVVFWVHFCPRRFLGLMAVLFFVFAVGNLIAEVAYPEGLYQAAWTHEACWLFGHKNSTSVSLLPGFLAIGMYETLRGSRHMPFTICYIGLLIVNCFFSRSSTSIFVSVLITALFFVMKIWPNLRFGPLLVGTGWVVASATLVIFRVQERFAGLIQFLFHKNATFSSRTGIWDSFMSLFVGSPIIGVGDVSSEIYRQMTGGVNAHNALLDVLVTGGFVRLAVYLVGLLVLGAALRSHLEDWCIRLFTLVLVGFAVYGLMETFDGSWFLLVSCAMCEGCVALIKNRRAHAKS